MFSACANPSIVRIKSEKIHIDTIEIILIPRFEGNPSFVEESTDMFVSKLEAALDKKIIQIGSLRKEGEDVQAGGNIVSTEIALLKAKEFNADIVILGKVTSHHTSGLLNGFSTIRVIDSKTGEIIASFHRPSGLLIAHSEHQCVMAAVSRTAKDMISALK